MLVSIEMANVAAAVNLAAAGAGSGLRVVNKARADFCDVAASPPTYLLIAVTLCLLNSSLGR